MSVLQQFKCPCCDGAIEFDSSAQKMKCPYCGTEFDMAALQLQEQQTEEGMSAPLKKDTDDTRSSGGSF